MFLPDRTTVGIGRCYRFQLDGRDTVLRVSLSNVLDVHGYDLFCAGTHDIIDGWKLSVFLVADF